MIVNVEDIEIAVAHLRAGELVAFPTETVYGLGADAENAEAITCLYQIKNRPPEHPVIIHVADRAHAERYVHFNALAEKCAAHFWPGPFTLLLPRTKHVLDSVTGGQDCVAIRVSSHLVALALLKAFGSGVVAPSANRFGQLSPTHSEHVRQGLGAGVSMILEGGASHVGIESTLLDCTKEHPVLLRAGMITREQIESVIGEPVHEATRSSARVSGSCLSHYAPRTPLYCWDEQHLMNPQSEFSNKKVAVLAWKIVSPKEMPTAWHWINMPPEPRDYAHRLYATLHALDNQAYDAIVVEAVPSTDRWAGIADRLKKASHRSTLLT